MNDDTSKNTGFGGNSFNTNNTSGTNNKPEPDLNPKFSGMPTSRPEPHPSQPAVQPAPSIYVPAKSVFAPSPVTPPAPAPVVPTPVPAVSFQVPAQPIRPVSAFAPNPTFAPTPTQFPTPTQIPTPTPTPVPTPAPAPVQSRFASAPQNSYTPPPMPASTPSFNGSSMQANLQSSNSYIKAQQVRQQQNKSGSRGILGIIIFFVIVALAVVAFWFFVPADFSFSKYLNLSNIIDSIKGNGAEEGTIEDKVANPAEQPAANQNSMFPTGVINSGNTSNTSGTAKPSAPSAPVKPVTKTSNTYSMSDQDKVSSFIRANINRIAKTSGYVVTDVTFDGPSRAIVTYSKGNTVRSAIINTSIDSSGNVKITGFTPLTK